MVNPRKLPSETHFAYTSKDLCYYIIFKSEHANKMILYEGVLCSKVM